MKNSSIIEVIRTLDKKEWKEFAKWLDSSFFNQRQDVADLFQYLSVPRHLEDDKFLDKERIYRKLFPNEPFDDAKFRQTTHFLLKQLEQFLAFREIQEDTHAMDMALIKALRKRKASSLFHRKFNTLQRTGLGNNQLLDGDGLHYRFVLLSEHYTHMLATNQAKNEHLQEASLAFDLKFMAEKLKQACLELSHNRVFKTNFEVQLIQEIVLAIHEKPAFLDYPAIAIYYYGYQIQQKGEGRDDDYFRLKEAIAHHESIFSADEQTHIYRMILNYCIERMNKGAAAFIREGFEIYKKGLSSGFLLQDGILAFITFLNIGSAAIRLKEYDWVRSFVNTYTPYLEEQHRENGAQYTLGKLAFEQKRYDEAMNLLFRFDSKHLLLTLNARVMMVKIYYEQDEYDALESLLESTKTYLKRKENIGYQKAVFENMIRLTRKLVRINPYDKSKREELRREIENTNPLTERAWLLEQLDKMG
ncbi:MAG: hypothetical protein R2795_06055 [Saprospiraceae bacterium]